MTCPHTRALLDLSTAMLAMHRELKALRLQVEAVTTRKPWITWERLADIAKSIGEFSKTPFGQSLIGAVIAGVGCFIRWITGAG